MVSNIAGQGVVDTVPTNSAFWLYALERTVVKFKPVTALAHLPKAKAELKPGDFVLTVAAEAGGSRDAAVAVGVVSGQAVRVENPPAMPGMVDVWVEGRGGALAADLRDKAAKTMVWRLGVRAPEGADEIAISLPDLSRLPADKQIVLVDLDTGRKVYMRTQPRYVMTASAGVRHLELRIEDRSGAALVVSSAQARQEGGHAVVTFSVSKAARVTAEVMNMAGRVVARVATDRAVPAGANTLAWNLRSDAGSPVPAGRYLVRIVAVADDGQQQATVTQLVVKR
ncbi:MAG: hypothetical protein J7M26_07890, partial [Armatimonadetes bacterium]|nr:hypothetical protein [Armatimonadota bacterium]